MPASRPQRWDIFCKVVDNFGDIGVCWRLSRQLAAEHGLAVRLWVDDLPSFSRICPALQLQDEQWLSGVCVRRWAGDLAAEEVAEVVIDAFGCGLPPAYQARMPAGECQWVTLEYLSAEDWIAGCHGRASQLPGVNVPRRFYFPGFVFGTGGLLRERDLIARRDAFEADPQAAPALLQRLGVPARQALRVLLFCYPSAPIEALFEAFAQVGQPVQCLVPDGASWQQRLPRAAGSLTVHTIPFVRQEDFDALLWAMDVNVVRGEDSFVRAQWAARPFVWQIYPQNEAAHRPKLAAFLDLYCAGMPPEAAGAQRALWQGFNSGAVSPAEWQAFVALQPALRAHARRWSAQQGAMPDLAARLVQFCAEPV